MDKRLLLLLLCFSKSLAQTPQKAVADTIFQTQLETVYISSLHLNDSLLHAPAAIGILGKSDLQRNNHTDISLAMNRVPGVFMQSSNFTTSRISIRGIGARTPYGTNKIRAFFGSIPLTSGDSETTIDDIDLENIAQIEIIKGPLSSIYGAGLGGAVLVAPQLSENAKTATVSTTHGSFGLVKNTIGLGIGTKANSLNISYHKLETDGWRENSAYRREGVTLAGELFRKTNSRLTYFGNFTNLKSYIPSSIDKKTFDQNPRAAAPTWLASKGYKQYDSALGGLGYEFKVGKINGSTSVFLNYKDNYETRPFDVLHQYTLASGVRTQFSGDFKIVAIPGHFVAGFEYFNDTYKGRTLENDYKQNNGQGSLQGDLLTANSQKRNFYNAFAQLRLSFTKQLELQSGLNVNRTHFDLENTYRLLENKQQYRYEAIFSPQVSLLYKLSQEQTIYVSVSKGFSLPSVSETLTASGAINTGIKPESGYNYEVGAKLYFLGRVLFAEVAFYSMQIKDQLVARRTGDDQYVGINAGKTLHEGVEIGLNHLWQINRVFTMKSYVSASFGEYRFEDFIDNGSDYSGNRLTGVPSHKAGAGFTLRYGSGWYFGSDFLFVDKIPLNDANTAFADAYKTVNAKMGYNFQVFQNFSADFAFGVNNIANEHYASLILPNALPVGSGMPRYYYPGLPVNYYGNMRFNYSF